MMQSAEDSDGKRPEGNLIQTFHPGNWNMPPRFAAVIIATLGLAVLAGWMFSIPLLKSVLPDRMSPFSAATFAVIGLALSVSVARHAGDGVAR